VSEWEVFASEVVPPAEPGVVAVTPFRAESKPVVVPGALQCVQIGGTDLVPDDATGVMLNVTTVRPTSVGYVSVFPGGTSVMPATSTVNFEPGQDVANTTFVALGEDGDVCYGTAGAPQVGILLDVTGYTTDSSGVVLQAPQRLLDTRSGAGHVGSVTGPVTPRQEYTVQVTGQAGVPEGATAAIVNVTVTGATTVGNLRVYQGGTDVPLASTVNFAPGREKANGTVVELSAEGELAFYSDSPVSTGVSPVQVIIDVVGYLVDGSELTSVTPTRVVETRASGHVGPFPGALTAGTVYTLDVAGQAGVPAGASAVVLNVTAVSPTSNGNLRVFPAAAGAATLVPLASSVNYIPGRDIPNMVIV
jgi:hypothetical protein